MGAVSNRVVRYPQHRLASQLGQQSGGLVRPLKKRSGEIDDELCQCAFMPAESVTSSAKLNVATPLLDVIRVRADARCPQQRRGNQ